MKKVTIRELRNRGGDVVDRVARGETLTVTRSGVPVAELRPLSRLALEADTLLANWKRLRPIDPSRLREDIDAVVDQSL